MTDFEWPFRIYYEDTDSGGVVYHSNYLNFMERARTEWLRSLGFEQDELITQHQCLFAVHSMQLNFRRPAKFNDALVVRSHVVNVSGASMEFEQKIFRDDELLCEAVVKIACLDANRFRPKSIPSFMLTEIQGER
ncbi:MAG: tol-pal system-associated acyl-CoA thioesterase [Gammaproteobacteria bacterium]|nr:tol-pal system-associated acyl-CoA thioesterase [Gammaproteobacteria bacterium]MDH5591469.1 tol-pal system-associated acyl-CoA thioesterase [Gammaproteobacteria bacterium]